MVATQGAYQAHAHPFEPNRLFVKVEESRWSVHAVCPIRFPLPFF